MLRPCLHQPPNINRAIGRAIALTTAFLVVAVCQAARGDLIDYWNFNTLINNTDNGTLYTSSNGTPAMITLEGWNSNGVGAKNGTVKNAVNSEPAGQSLELRRAENNGGALILSVDLSAYVDPILSLASRRNGNGFDSIQLSWSTDGSVYTNFGPAFDPGNGTFDIQSFDFSSVDDLDGASTAYIKFTFDGATSNGSRVRLDNIQINALNTTAIPEPSAIAFGAFGVLFMSGIAVKRRRRKASLN